MGVGCREGRVVHGLAMVATVCGAADNGRVDLRRCAARPKSCGSIDGGGRDARSTVGAYAVVDRDGVGAFEWVVLVAAAVFAVAVGTVWIGAMLASVAAGRVRGVPFSAAAEALPGLIEHPRDPAVAWPREFRDGFGSASLSRVLSWERFTPATLASAETVAMFSRTMISLRRLMTRRVHWW